MNLPNNPAARVDRAACGGSEDLARCAGESDEPQARQNREGHREPPGAGSTPARGTDYERMFRFAAISGLVDDCAQAWHAVGQAEVSPLGDPSLKYRKQEALEATKALKDAINGLYYTDGSAHGN